MFFLALQFEVNKKILQTLIVFGKSLEVTKGRVKNNCFLFYPFAVFLKSNGINAKIKKFLILKLNQKVWKINYEEV